MTTFCERFGPFCGRTREAADRVGMKLLGNVFIGVFQDR
jgi:hypothetical protein